MGWRGWSYTKDAELHSQVSRGTDLRLVEAGIHQILNTSPGERRMLPDFGSRIRFFIFEPKDDILYAEIGREVLRAIERWEPRIYIESVQINEVPDNEHAIQASIAYRLRNNESVSSSLNVVVSA